LWELYVLDGNSFTGRASVPLLIDITDGKPVCNQSVDLMRMFNKFGDPNTPNLFPDVPGFEAMLTRIVKELNEGAYRAAAAPNQQDYDNSVNAYFSALDEFEERLSNTRFLWSNDDITACDIRLFVTLIRWEFVYHNLFDLNKKTLTQYPNLFNFSKEMYQHPKIRPTIDISVMRQTYYHEFIHVQPNRILCSWLTLF